jgi:hypothetical protein
MQIIIVIFIKIWIKLINKYLKKLKIMIKTRVMIIFNINWIKVFKVTNQFKNKIVYNKIIK